MWDIVICSILAVLFGANTWEDIHDFVGIYYSFLRKFLLMTGDIPHKKTYERVMTIIKSEELENIFNDFLMTFYINKAMEKDIINIDGRVSKGSARNQTAYTEKIKPLMYLMLIQIIMVFV